MGNESLARTSELLSFNAHYVVAGDNTRDRLLDDAGCFMESAMALFRKELVVADSPAVRRIDPELAARLWGIYHLLQMVQGITEATHGHGLESLPEHVS